MLQVCHIHGLPHARRPVLPPPERHLCVTGSGSAASHNVPGCYWAPGCTTAPDACSLKSQKAGVQVACAQHPVPSVSGRTGLTVNRAASILLPSICSVLRCHLHAALWMSRMVSRACTAQAWQRRARRGQRCATQSSAQLHPPFHPGGWLPSRAAAKFFSAW